MTKVEFASSTWGDSFGKMTQCERIVSLDCRGPKGDERVWLTWLYNNGSSASYVYIFYIKAKDLIGE